MCCTHGLGAELKTVRSEENYTEKGLALSILLTICKTFASHRIISPLTVSAFAPSKCIYYLENQNTVIIRDKEVQTAGIYQFPVAFAFIQMLQIYYSLLTNVGLRLVP